MKNAISGIIRIIFLQVIFFIIPIAFYNDFDYVYAMCFVLNMIFTWYIIKSIEKEYYKNYNKINSMLYMLCPLTGVSLITYIFYRITNIEVVINYYIPLYIGVFIVNIIYILIEYARNK